MALEGENYSKINHIIKDSKELITTQYQEYNSWTEVGITWHAGLPNKLNLMTSSC